MGMCEKTVIALRRAAFYFFVLVLTAATSNAGPIPQKPKAPQSLRVYVIDCGTSHNVDLSRYRLTRNEVATNDVSVGCFLIVHPKGTLMWDTGVIPDKDWTTTSGPLSKHLVVGGVPRELTVPQPLTKQLAQIGYSPADIKYLALSHDHYDHTGNANEFAGAMWLVRKVERDYMFSDQNTGTIPSYFSGLRDSKTTLIETDDYDVFGDGRVVIKSAPGHTPGHQVLFLQLAKTGRVVLSGDLYHFPEERRLGRIPTFEFNQDQTRQSRDLIEAFLKQTGAQLWIQHDFAGFAKLKKSPKFYD
jgi:glyoxylase-like metal-dependent hydrolase (beta-lactamase superfamily II)